MSAGAGMRLERVSKSYGADRQGDAVASIDLEVGSGEVVSVIGPSGCGKTTILHLVAGLLAPDDGRVVLDPPAARIGYVFQSPRLLPWRTAVANVVFPLEQRRPRDRAGARLAAERALAAVGLADHGGDLPSALSGGMAQRVALARALVIEPGMLLLDEPLGSLDAITRAVLQEELSRLLRTAGTTTLLVTHDIDEAVLLGDRVVVLTSRPARVMAVIDVPFPRPRIADALIADPRYPGLRRQLRSLLIGPAA